MKQAHTPTATLPVNAKPARQPSTAKVITVCARGSDQIQSLFDAAARKQGFAAALEEFARRHGITYVRAPADFTFARFVGGIARACSVRPGRTFDETRRDILRAFGRGMFLVVDDVHNIIAEGGRETTMAFEFLREIFDATGCGIITAGDEVEATEPESLSQFRRRVNATLRMTAA